MFTSTQEEYIGYIKLVSYLKNHRSKSFRGFLFRYREIIVESTFFTSETSWQDLYNFWTLKFLKEAEELELNRNTFNALNEKVRFLFSKEKVTPRRMRSDSGELLRFDCW